MMRLVAEYGLSQASPPLCQARDEPGSRLPRGVYTISATKALLGAEHLARLLRVVYLQSQVDTEINFGARVVGTILIYVDDC